MACETLTPVIAALLAASGNAAVVSECEALPAGGNNRVYRVAAGGRQFAAKHYFHDPAESRDRLRTEYGFLEHAWRCGVRCVPQPLAADPVSHLALYEFVAGRRLVSEDLGVERVVEAATLFAALNSKSSRAAGADLPLASDACLSVAQHVRSVDTRIDRLARIPAQTATEREATAFVTHLAQAWSAARDRILRALPEPESPNSHRSLSPSDFGFRNALIRGSGELCFLDFEYAGWDDPAKMAGDFFWHAGMRAPRQHFERFTAVAFAPLEDGAGITRRTRILSPAFRTRWACIALNEFLPDAARRRCFAGAGDDSTAEARKLAQLEKARTLFAEPDL